MSRQVCQTFSTWVKWTWPSEPVIWQLDMPTKLKISMMLQQQVVQPWFFKKMAWQSILSTMNLHTWNTLKQWAWLQKDQTSQLQILSDKPWWAMIQFLSSCGNAMETVEMLAISLSLKMKTFFKKLHHEMKMLATSTQIAVPVSEQLVRPQVFHADGA